MRSFAVTEEDRRDERFESINTEIREDRERVLMIDEDISEDVGNWAEIVTALADSLPFLQALSNMPEVAALKQSSAMPALYREAKRMADRREQALQVQVEEAFELSERDNRDMDEAA